MDRNFERALSAVLKHEGGFSNHPRDKGGPTNKGVTLANFRAYVKPGGTVEDLKGLTVAQAGTVYRRFYWDAVMGGELPDGVDYAVFDFAVNSGPTRAARFLQRIVGVEQDGAIGPKTLAAVRAMDARHLINALCDARQAWLKTLSDFAVFGRGWTNRISGVRALAVELSGQPQTAPKVIVEKELPVGAEKTAPLNFGLLVTVVGALGQFLAGLHPVVQGGGLLLIAVGLFVLWRDRAQIATEARSILSGKA